MSPKESKPRLFYPYTIGTKSPISHLFENIAEYVAESGFKITVFSIKSKPVLDHPLVREVYIPKSKPIVKRFQYVRNCLLNHDLIHTGGLIQRHYWINQITSRRNLGLSHLHSFRVDVTESYTKSKQPTLVSMADNCTAVSRHTAQTAREIYDVDPHVVYNGVDIELFNPDYDVPERLPEKFENPVVSFVGSLTERKRPRDVLAVAREIPDAQFMLFGGGELLDTVKSEGNDLENVTVFGHVAKSRLPAIYANSNCFLFPSVREGCANVVLEAMASGTPVVGYSATSMPELVTHGETGYLTPTGDIDELTEMTLRILEGRTDKFGQQARRYVETNHTFEEIAANYVDIYREIL